MDNVTHALAGLLLAEATVSVAARRTGRAPTAGLRRAAAVVGVVAAELPDIDIVYAGQSLGMGNLGYLLHHRGHTHTVLFAVAAAFLIWAAAIGLRRGLRAPEERRTILAVALVGTLSHILLDWTNNYGVHPFWPVDGSWYYGDAVFIIEPWLWIVAVPPLLFLARSRVLRALLAVALVGILAAAWRVEMVGTGLAAVLTAGAAASLLANAAMPAARRVAFGVVAWLAVEVVFFASSHRAREVVRATVPDVSALHDVALTPAVGNPLCFDALVVEADDERYRVSTARVAPYAALRDVSGCIAPSRGGGRGLDASPRAATAAMRWEGEWSAPADELAALAATDCEIAAALRFIRVPLWEREPDGAIHLWDLRYGRGGFASVDARGRADGCPWPIPDWVPPRAEMLGEH